MITDMESATPALCRLQLGSELRQLRLRAGLTSTQVVRKLLWSPSKLTRLETGENTVVETSDVMALCQILHASEEECELLKEYAAVTKRKREWWQSSDYRQAIPQGFRAFLGMEGAASALHSYESEFVPGLLQTEDYVRLIHRQAWGGHSDEDIDRIAEMRMMRKEVLHRKRPLKLSVIINEAVLLRQVGDPADMRAQLAHLIEAASLPNVQLQVLPFKAGPHRGMNGSFWTFRFRDHAVLKPIVYLENLADQWVARREADVELYEAVFSELQAVASSPQESMSVIKKAMEEYR